MTDRPKVLIEDWLPVVELGIESRREAAPIPGQFPKLKTLHVWWARRPLAASAGAILASLLPTWSDRLATAFPSVAATEMTYHHWFLNLCGIWGDPVAAKATAMRNKERGIRTAGNPYGYKPAFKNSPSDETLELLNRILVWTWQRAPYVVDPCAGGGSIPFEAMRYGLDCWANDLNPVAAAVLRAGLEIPTKEGRDAIALLSDWGNRLVARVSERLSPYFHAQPGEQVTNYIFARTVACPRTGKNVPLSPNWWLATGAHSVAVKLLTERGGGELDEIEFEIRRGDEIDFDPEQGTISGGDGISPWDGLAIDGEYIKAEAQSGRLGSQLYAVAIRTSAGRSFRAPNRLDLEALQKAEDALAHLERDWLDRGIIPSEDIPPGLKTGEPLGLGMDRWYKMFSPRQLLVHGTFVEEFGRLVAEVRSALAPDQAAAVLALLAMMQAKALNWDGYLASWDVTRDKTRSVFDQHNFSVTMGFAEFEGARELYPWCLEQIVDAYVEITSLLQPIDGELVTPTIGNRPRPRVTVTASNAANLPDLADGSATLVCIDPPYYDNVMYAELADYFYVWEKRTLGLVWPELFREELCDKKNEAVANPARFRDAGKSRTRLANADYEAKMTAIFAECHRILADDGVMTVMFTHKKAEAWDTLGMALMESGFTIDTSWPVNTESEQSLHQAKKNAAASTILLVCRKRQLHAGRHPYFEDIEADVRRAAREATMRFSQAGIVGVDLLLSTYGPALSVISSQWPVYSSEADDTGRSRLLRPEQALDAARTEVVRIQRQRLIGADTQLDPITDFALIAWDTFRAAEFPFDEARRLALATGGLDVDELARAKVLEKKSGTVVLLSPAKRLRRAGDDLPGVQPEATAFLHALDAVHTVMYVADVDGMVAARALIDRAGLVRDSRFLACLQGLVNAIPRTKAKGRWVREEAETLDRLCAAYFPEIEIPKNPEETEVLSLF